MSDINIGQISEALNDKMDRDANNIESPKLPVFLVAKQDPTSENNYTWYRKYSDGWIEQGGYVSSGSQTSVTFPFEMANTNYFATFMFGVNNTQVTYTGVQGTNRTTTGMNVCGYYNNGSNRSTIGEPMYWKIEGISAA